MQMLRALASTRKRTRKHSDARFDIFAAPTRKPTRMRGPKLLHAMQPFNHTNSYDGQVASE
eukprot:6186096-Pleurochrysis_carterae.AAC.1